MAIVWETKGRDETDAELSVAQEAIMEVPLGSFSLSSPIQLCTLLLPEVAWLHHKCQVPKVPNTH